MLCLLSKEYTKLYKSSKDSDIMDVINLMERLPIHVLSYWWYWIILLATVLESSPILGLLIPGQLIVMLGGFLAKEGVLDLGDVILIAGIGAVLGDLIGYLLGKRYGESFITKYGKYLFFKKSHFEKTKELMKNHAGKTLVIGRFNSLTRAFAPFVAGSTNVSFSRFLTYNIIGGISWAISFGLIGYTFGKSYEVASEYIGKFIFIAIVLSILIIYLYKFINKRRHIFTRYHLYALILNITSLYLFSKMIEDIIAKEMITKLDVWINTNIVFLWNPTLNRIMIFITNIISPINLFILLIILFAVLVYKKKWYCSLLLLFSVVGGLLFVLVTKLTIHRARPENALIEVSGYSFPSSHATMAIIFFLLLIYSFKDDIKNKMLRHVFIYFNIVLFLLVGISRVYLNVHWFSDIIGGFSLGLFWLTLLILVFKTIIHLSKKHLLQQQVS